jgi:hypothetical protein
MALEELTVFAAGYWLAESRAKGDTWRMNWESAAGIFQDAVDLAWQLFLLGGWAWGMHEMSIRWPQANFAGLGLTLALAYGLSLLRRRSEGGATSYFLALTVLAFALQQSRVSAVGENLVKQLSLMGGSLACACVLLGLKERLRWSWASHAVHGTPIVLLCLALMALIIRSMGF